MIKETIKRFFGEEKVSQFETAYQERKEKIKEKIQQMDEKLKNKWLNDRRKNIIILFLGFATIIITFWDMHVNSEELKEKNHKEV